MKLQGIRKPLHCLIAAASFYVCPASAQLGTITNVGATVTEMDAITFNGSGVLYGATGDAGALYTINPATGAATLVHALVGASNASLTYGVNGLAFQPGTGTLYGTASPDSPNSGNSLVTINPTTAQVTVIGPSGTGYPYTNIAFAPNGTLYGWLVGSGGTTASLATINLTTGAGTSLGSPQNNAIVPYVGLAINPGGVIYVAANGHAGAPGCGGSCSGAIWSINPANGSPTTIATVSGGPGVAPAITALAFSPTGVLYGIEGGDGGGWNLILINISPVQTIVVPNAQANSPGNNNTGGVGRYAGQIIQQLYASGQFPGAINITGLSLRAAPGTGPVDGTDGTISVYLSTSPNSPNSTSGTLMSTTFADNIGPDNTLVFSATNLTLSDAGCSGPGACPFDLNLNFTTPFLYNPLAGNLLVELILTNTGGTNGSFDVEGFEAPGGSIAFLEEDGNTTASTGTAVEFAGIITQFTYNTVPIILVANEAGGMTGAGTIGAYTTSGATVNTALISGLNEPKYLAASGSDVFLSNQFAGTIGEYTTSGGLVNAALISGLNDPTGIAVSGSNLFVSNPVANTISEYTTSGVLVNAALISGLNGPYGIAVSGSDLFVTNEVTGTIGEYTTSGATVNTALISGLNDPRGIVVDGSNVFVTNHDGGTIGEYTTSGATVNTALISGLNVPSGLALYGSDLFVVSNAGNTVGEYTTSGATVNASLISGLNEPWGIAIVPSETLTGLQGGAPGAPVFLLSDSPLAEVTGTISGLGSEEYYEFYWAGGAFSATASITGTINTGASYLFSEGAVGSCNSQAVTLTAAKGFTGTITSPNLPAGYYCIGLNANSPNDPTFTLTFNTPVAGQASCGVLGHGTVTVSDVQQMISEALGAAPPANDLNGDGIVNVTDVQVVTDAALNLGCSARPVSTAGAAAAAARLRRR